MSSRRQAWGRARRGLDTVLVTLLVLPLVALIAPPTPAAAPAPDRSCTIRGTGGADRLVGGPGRDVICGRGGDDVIVGGGGDDVLRGQGGRDDLRGGSGDDLLVGGAGNDQLDGRDGRRFRDRLRCGAGPLDSAAADEADAVSGSCEIAPGAPTGSAPTDLGLDPARVGEDAPVGTEVGRLSAVDADADDSHDFSLVAGEGDRDNDLFVVEGEVLRTAAGLDFETRPELSVRLRVEDSGGRAFEKAVTITVTDVFENRPPVAADDTATGSEDTVVRLPLTGPGSPLANDSDPDGDPLTLTAVGGAEGGTVQLSGDHLDFAPFSDRCGVAAGSFSYTVTDAHGGTDDARVAVDLTCGPDAPQAVDDRATVREDAPATAVDVLGNDVDADGDRLTIASVTQPGHGTVVITGGGAGLTYAPDADYCNSGAGPVDAFDYTLTDGGTARVSVTVTCDDDAPVAVGDATTVTEDDGATAVDVLANDTDVDTGPKAIASATDPAHGTVSLTGGSAGAHTGLTYRPDADYCNSGAGPDDTFDYTLNGGDTATVSVTVTCVDDAPRAVDDSATVDEDAVATAIDVLANDDDADGGSLEVVSATDPAHGTVMVDGDGSGLTYRPDADYCNSGAAADDTFDYTLNGGDTATVSVTVTCVDDAPVAVDDSATVDEDAAATAVPVLANDTDVDGGPKAIASTTDPAHGTVTVSGDGASLTYEPDAGYCNSGGVVGDTFDYTLNGGDVATVSVRVTCLDDPPTATDDNVTTAEDLPPTPYHLLGNDLDPDGGPLLITEVTQPAHGTVVLTSPVPGGHTWVTYEPDPDYCNSSGGAEDTFTYTLNGGSTARVSVLVVCLDDAPVAVDDATTMAEDSPAAAVEVLANDTDIDGGRRVIASATDPGHGTVVLTGGVAGAHTGLTYRPDADYCNSGAGPVDTFDYTLNGGTTATVSVTVTCDDDAPVAVGDATSVTEDDGATAVDVLANDTDVDTGPKAIASATDPAHGTVSLTGGSAGAHTGLSYRPDADYCNSGAGPDDTFDYTLNGGDTATVSVTVTCVDDAPVAVDDTATLDEDAAATAVPVLANDTDVDGGPKTIASTTDPAHGTVTVSGDGASLTYRPDADYCNSGAAADDTFDYTLNGGDTATVSVTVTCVDDAPVAVDDTATVDEDAAATAVPVLANDTDVDGGPKAIASATDPAHGTVTVSGDGASLTYRPDADYCNSGADPDDTFSYTLGSGDTATVSVAVTCVDDAPVAVDDTATTRLDAAAGAVDVLANDTDVDGGPKAIVSFTQPTHGTVVLTGPAGARDGLTYTPDAAYCNTQDGGTPDAFTYTLSGGDTATVRVTVTCDVPPVAVDDTATVDEDAAATAVPVLANDTDPDGGPKTIASATDPAHGTVAVTGGGTGLTYRPDADYCNTDGGAVDTFDYTLNGGDAATVRVTVTCVDDPPTAADDTTTVAEDDVATAVPVLANDDNVDGGPKVIASATDPAHGTVVVSGGGTSLTYAPDADYCNTGGGTVDTFDYALNGGDTATVRVTVTCVNDAPVADDETFGGADAAVRNTTFVSDDPSDGAPTVTGPRKLVTGDLLAGDADVDGPGALAVEAGTVLTAGGGTVQLQADGDFVYQPKAGCAAGTDSFDYTVRDQATPTAGTDTGHVTIELSGCVWYVDNAAPAGGGGTSGAPFDTLAEAEQASLSGDTVYVYAGDGTTKGYTAGFDLKSGQQLLGASKDLRIGGVLLAAGTAGSRPTLTDDNADVVALAAGTTVSGLQVDPKGSGGGIAGGTGDAGGTIADVRIIDTGAAGTQPGLELDGTSGTWAVSDLVVDSSAATSPPATAIGVRLNNAGTVGFADAGTVTIKVSGAKGLDATGTNLGTSVFDDIRSGGSTAGGISMVNTTGSTTFTTMQLTTTGATAALRLSSAGTVKVTGPNAMILASGGSAVDVSGTPGAVLDFLAASSLDSTGAGIRLANLGSGTFRAGPTSLVSNPAGIGFDLDGGSGSVVYDGTITSSLGLQVVRVQNATGGTKSFTGAIEGHRQGVSLSSNTGATVRFDGGLTLSTGANPALVATGGGTLAVTDPAGSPVNTLRTTTGTALSVLNTTIHDDDLTFQSISSQGAPSGISLSNTGNAGGRLVITANGGACTSVGTCTGGAIQTSTGSGVVLNGVPGGATLNRIAVTGSGDDGIAATNVAGGIRLDSSWLSSNGNATIDSGLDYVDVRGLSTIQSSDIIASAGWNARIGNTTGTLDLTVTDTDFKSAIAEDGLQLKADGTATIRSSVTGNRFDDNKGDAIQVTTDGAAPSSISDHTITGNTIDGFTGGALDGGITYSPDGSSRATISNNAITGVSTSAIIINPSPVSGTGAQFDAVVNANTIGTAGVPDSGSADGDGIQLKSASDGASRISITNNVVRGFDKNGIWLRASESGAGATTSVVATGNQISQPDPVNSQTGLILQAGSLSSDVLTMCADVSGNTFSGPLSPTGIGAFWLSLRFSSAALRVPGYSGSTPAQREAYFLGRNTGFVAGNGVPAYVEDGTVNLQNQAGGCALPNTPTLPTAP